MHVTYVQYGAATVLEEQVLVQWSQFVYRKCYCQSVTHLESDVHEFTSELIDFTQASVFCRLE